MEGESGGSKKETEGKEGDELVREGVAKAVTERVENNRKLSGVRKYPGRNRKRWSAMIYLEGRCVGSGRVGGL